jgi:hypothetical protein
MGWITTKQEVTEKKELNVEQFAALLAMLEPEERELYERVNAKLAMLEAGGLWS